MYAIERRQEIKASNPELSFPEVTKILGNEWSTLDSQKKQVLPINIYKYTMYVLFFLITSTPFPLPSNPPTRTQRRRFTWHLIWRYIEMELKIETTY